MKIVFYSPYLPNHFGGGEKYLFEVALTYVKKHKIYVALPAKYKNQDLSEVKKRYEEFLGQDLDKINFIISPFGGRGKKIGKILWTAKFDVVYYVTDGSAFFSLARKNIMHIQVPLMLEKKKRWQKIKFNCFKIINTNSYFTKKIVEKYWGIKVNKVCQPGVKIAEFDQVREKEKIILHVGRFFENLHCKNQDILVEIFRNLRLKYPEEMKGWKLILIGNVESEAYFNKVKKLSTDLPVEILTNLQRKQLIEYYQKASIYWHATGFLDEEWKNPEKMEHFGISTVEAMAAGCAPIVIGKGGQKEILGLKLKEWCWLSEKECILKTIKLIKNQKKLEEVSQLSRKRAEKFASKNFEKRNWELLS